MSRNFDSSIFTLLMILGTSLSHASDTGDELLRFHTEVILPVMARDAENDRILQARRQECISRDPPDVDCLRGAIRDLIEGFRVNLASLQEARLQAPEVLAVRDSLASYFEQMIENEEGRFQALLSGDEEGKARSRARADEILEILVSALKERNRLAEEHGVSLPE